MNDKLKIQHKEQMKFQSLHQDRPEELSSMDRAIIGGSSVRLDIPLTSTQDLRRLPDIFKGLASFVEFTLSRRELSEREKLSAIGNEIRGARVRFRDIAGREKFNGNGTVRR